MRLSHVAVVIIAVLIVEMYLLIQIGGGLGAFTTIALVFITAALGIWMLRLQGLNTLRKASFSAVQGEAPVREALEGVLLVVGGVLLLIPGFFTDGLGFLLLLPPIRKLLLRRMGENPRVAQADGQNPGSGRSKVIEGEWKRVDSK